MKLVDIINSDELLNKWLKYGYYRLTGEHVDDIDTIINRLRQRGHSDDAILRLAKHTHSRADTPLSVFY